MINPQVYQMGPMMNPDQGLKPLAYLLGIVIVLLLIIIFYLWFNQGKKQAPIAEPEKHVTPDVDKVEVVLRLLNENERAIVQALIDHDGEMLQKDISYYLDLTRVQTHRAIQSLIEREIVSSEPHFNTNLVTLRPWLLE
jgi:uncharacterized membrane protein